MSKKIDNENKITSKENLTINDNDTVICIDSSGSTGYHIQYWNRVLEIIESHPNAKFISWASSSTEMSYNEIKELAKDRNGYGGTSPSSFISLIKGFKNLIIITDGQVSGDEVLRCDGMLKNIKFDHVRVIFIKTGGFVNLSVSAPFTRNTTYVIENEGHVIEGSTDIDIDLSKYNENPSLFLEEYEIIRNYIVMKNIGTTNTTLRNMILDCKSKMMKYIRSKNSISTNDLLEKLKENDYDTSINITKSIFNSCFDSLISDIENSFDELINLCDLKNNFSFTLLQPSRIQRAKITEEVDVSKVNVIKIDDKYECPITCDNDSPCLLIKSGEAVLNHLNKKDLDMIITNPLIVLLRDDIKENIKKRVDHIIGFNTYKTLFENENGNIHSPYSRDEISCGILFGHHSSHLKAFNYTLSNIFFGRKLVGLPILWVYVLYKVLKEVEHIKDNETFFNEYEKYFIERLKYSKTTITLSGLPIHPFIETTADIAVWYCVVSPFIIGNEQTDDGVNRLRSFGATSKYLIEILNMLGYPYDKKKTLKLMSLYKAFSWMMNEERNEGHSLYVENQWLKKIKSHYQGSIVLDDGYIVLIDGPATEPNELPEFRIFDDQEPLKLNELIYLSKLVDMNKSTNSVIIDLELVENHPMPEYIVSYGYDYSKDFDSSVFVVSPDTMRPYSVDRKTNTLWKDAAINIFGVPLEKQISLYARFIDYVTSNKEFPSKIDFIKYLERKERMKVDYPKLTLPKIILKMVDIAYNSYKPICGDNFCNVTVDSFISKTSKSCSLLKRFEEDGSKDLYQSIYEEIEKMKK